MRDLVVAVVLPLEGAGVSTVEGCERRPGTRRRNSGIRDMLGLGWPAAAFADSALRSEQPQPLRLADRDRHHHRVRVVGAAAEETLRLLLPLDHAARLRIERVPGREQ